MARPENRSEARALSLTLPLETFNYLALLATLGKLGRTENEWRRISSFARPMRCLSAAFMKSVFRLRTWPNKRTLNSPPGLERRGQSAVDRSRAPKIAGLH